VLGIAVFFMFLVPTQLRSWRVQAIEPARAGRVLAEARELMAKAQRVRQLLAECFDVELR